MSDGINEHERAILQLVREGGDRASWYWLGTRAPLRGIPPVPDLRAVLKDLRARGFVDYREVGDGMDRWWLTPAGELVLDGSTELALLVAAMRKDVVTALTAIRPLADDTEVFCSALRQVVAIDEQTTRNAATAAMVLHEAERAAFLRELAADPRPSVRAALFDAFAPPRVAGPGAAVRALPEPEFDQLLRAGLRDEDNDVRRLAAKLTYAAGRGGPLVDELVAQLDTHERELRWWAIQALGTAQDPRSLELLERIANEDDPMMAEAARRALAGRRNARTPVC